MDAIQLGSTIISLQVAIPALGLFAANAVAFLFHKQREINVEPVLWKMTFVGLAVARLTFVLRHSDIYINAPLSIFDFRDRGFDGTVGLIAACLVGAELVRQHIAMHRPLLAATIVGCAVWLGGTQLSQFLTPSGRPLPTLEVQRLDGSSAELQDLVGRPLVVNLWATWCPPCKRELPALVATQQANPDINFVFINQGESAETVRNFLLTHGVQAKNVMLDPSARMSQQVRSPGYPTTLFYDSTGLERLRTVGELSEATLREKLGQLNGSAKGVAAETKP